MAALRYHGQLPSTALVRVDDAISVTQSMAVPNEDHAMPPAPVWFTAQDRSSLTRGPLGRIVEWAAQRPSNLIARSMSFDAEGTVFDEAAGALVFEARVHTGLVVSDLLAEGSALSFAVIYAPLAPNPRTIVTIQGSGEENYAFASVEEGQLRIGIKGGDQVLSLADPGGLTLLLGVVDGNQIRMAVNDSPDVRGAFTLKPGLIDIFIGCRGAGRSLRNKIGDFRLFDVMVWPGVDILSAANQKSTDSARRLWQQRCKNGV